MTEYIKTQRLEIKPFFEEDKTAMEGLLLNDKIKKTYMIPDFEDEAALDKMRRRYMDLSHSDKGFVRGIYRSGSLVGFVNHTEVREEWTELGFVIHPDHWNKGYATEMLTAVIAELLKNGVPAVKTGVFEENTASARVMEKSGMMRIDETEEIEYRGKKHTVLYYIFDKNTK